MPSPDRRSRRTSPGLDGSTRLVLFRAYRRPPAAVFFCRPTGRRTSKKVILRQKVARRRSRSRFCQSRLPCMHSLMARLYRLGAASKEIAQIGAVLGREFTYELIEPVVQRDRREVEATFDDLSYCTSPYVIEKTGPADLDPAFAELLRGGTLLATWRHRPSEEPKEHSHRLELPEDAFGGSCAAPSYL